MADSARSARAQALEEKKRRLEELKARRSRRDAAPPAPRPTTANLDEYIVGLIGPQESAPTTEISSDVASEPAATTETQVASASEGDLAREAPAEAAAAAPPTPVAPPVPAPKQTETFEFGTQTLDEDFQDQDEEEETPMDTTTLLKEQEEGAVPAEADDDELAEVEPKLLTEEEKQATVEKVPFSSFLNTASKKVERLLGEPVLADLLVNFVGETDEAKDASQKQSKDGGSKYVLARQVFQHAKWTANRSVTDMDWSPLHRELMLSTYNHLPSGAGGSNSTTAPPPLTAITPDVPPSSSLTPRSGELQADGLALVWNLSMPSRPEHIFSCASPITCGLFHPTTSSLVLGACQSGQLVVWDIRAGRLPVQRSGQGYPIRGMQVTEGKNGLVTAASDGKLCFWSLANLQAPSETVKLDGNLTCVATAEGNTLVCGDESGDLFVIPPKRKQVKRLAAQHYGVITGVSTKKKLILSSGVDWTVKLYGNKGLWNVVSNSYDYMCDVQWNPVHPSLLGTASSNGTVGLWNLAKSLDEPCGEIHVEDAELGLNKIKWSIDGRRMLVAAGDRVHVLSLSDEIVRPKGNEEEKMKELLS